MAAAFVSRRIDFVVVETSRRTLAPGSGEKMDRTMGGNLRPRGKMSSTISYRFCAHSSNSRLLVPPLPRPLVSVPSVRTAHHARGIRIFKQLLGGKGIKRERKRRKKEGKKKNRGKNRKDTRSVNIDR